MCHLNEYLFQAKDIFSTIEKFKSIKIAPCIKKILKSSAYNAASNLSTLNDQNVLAIENYINDSGRDVIQTLECCYSSVYKQQTRFQFLPGHKSTILSIPKYIDEMNGAKKKNQLEFKKLLTASELKKMLLNRINQNISNYNNIAKFSEDSITDVQISISDNAMSAKCKINCVECTKIIPVTYTGSWKTSNILRHVRQHLFQKQRRNS